jgi:hypothetical protein
MQFRETAKIKDQLHKQVVENMQRRLDAASADASSLMQSLAEAKALTEHHKTQDRQEITDDDRMAIRKKKVRPPAPPAKPLMFCNSHLLAPPSAERSDEPSRVSIYESH